ncbi:hypothetical protein FBUS_04926 [Fasciolopsis buskii]|uniref:Uncharacterized protein n=1 Tax=Fasciolopsis buskii TaxID=27845 RepID=A0A8E0VNT5_9TREM|nr:hypothetical protein FBUS_04926 [Fasciolopsis buski]
MDRRQSLPKERRGVTFNAHVTEEIAESHQDFLDSPKTLDANVYPTSKLREVPTRKVNKKWYDSTLIPFMDDDVPTDRASEPA